MIIKPRKAIIAGTILIALAIFFAAYFLLIKKTPDQEGQNEKVNEETTRRAAELEKTNEIFDQAISQANYDRCLEYGDPANINSCLRSYALAKENMHACNKISDEKIKNDCSDRLIHVTAIKALKIEECLKINQEHLRRSCALLIIEQGQFTEGGCMQGPIELRGLCMESVYLKKAREEREAKYCDKIEDHFVKQECRAMLGSDYEKSN